MQAFLPSWKRPPCLRRVSSKNIFALPFSVFPVFGPLYIVGAFGVEMAGLREASTPGLGSHFRGFTVMNADEENASLPPEAVNQLEKGFEVPVDVTTPARFQAF